MSPCFYNFVILFKVNGMGDHVDDALEPEESEKHVNSSSNHTPPPQQQKPQTDTKKTNHEHKPPSDSSNNGVRDPQAAGRGDGKRSPRVTTEGTSASTHPEAKEQKLICDKTPENTTYVLPANLHNAMPPRASAASNMQNNVNAAAAAMAARQQSMEFRKQGPGLGNAMPAVVGVGMEHKLLSATPHNSLSNNNNNAVIRNNLAGGGALIVDNSMMRSGEEDVFKAKAAVGKNEDDDELNIEHITSMVDNLGVDSDDDDLLSQQQQQQLTNGGRPRPGNEQQADPSIVFAKKAEPGKSINGLQDWIYRDPQCEIQGPFTNEEMLEWFKAGYFNISLLVRRVCDEVFLPLGMILYCIIML